jgi:hypothetical protein
MVATAHKGHPSTPSMHDQRKNIYIPLEPIQDGPSWKMKEGYIFFTPINILKYRGIAKNIKTWWC